MCILIRQTSHFWNALVNVCLLSLAFRIQINLFAILLLIKVDYLYTQVRNWDASLKYSVVIVSVIGVMTSAALCLKVLWHAFVYYTFWKLVFQWVFWYQTSLKKNVYFMRYINLKFWKGSPKYIIFLYLGFPKTLRGFPSSYIYNIEAKCLKFCGMQRG